MSSWKRACLCGSSGNTRISCSKVFWAGMAFTMFVEVENCSILCTCLLRTSQIKPLFCSKPAVGFSLPRVQHETLGLAFKALDIRPHPTLSFSSCEVCLDLYRCSLPQHTCLWTSASKVAPAYGGSLFLSQILSHHLPSKTTSSRKSTISTLPQGSEINPSSEPL